MSTALQQALADLEGKRAEQTYDLYRNWSTEYALKAIEEHLTASYQGELDAVASSSPRHLRRVGFGVLGATLEVALVLLAWLR